MPKTLHLYLFERRRWSRTSPHSDNARFVHDKTITRYFRGAKGSFSGDLRYGRTVHSLSHALTRFGCELIFASPELLKASRNCFRFNRPWS